MKEKPAYYSVFALQDKTALAALQTRKPVGSRRGRRPKIDPEGIHSWYVEEAKDFRDLPEVQAATRHSTIATCLNLRRIVRERVEARFDQLDVRMRAMQAQLDRIENALVTFVEEVTDER